MHDLFGFVAAIAVLWRIVLCGGVGLAVAFGASHIFTGLPGTASTALAVLGASVGAVWHIGVLAKRQPVAKRTQPEMSRTFMFLGASVIGCGWGWFIAEHLGPLAAVVSLLLGPLLLSPVFSVVAKQPVALSAVAFITVAFLSGYLSILGLQWAVRGA